MNRYNYGPFHYENINRFLLWCLQKLSYMCRHDTMSSLSIKLFYRNTIFVLFLCCILFYSNLCHLWRTVTWKQCITNTNTTIRFIFDSSHFCLFIVSSLLRSCLRVPFSHPFYKCMYSGKRQIQDWTSKKKEKKILTKVIIENLFRELPNESFVLWLKHKLEVMNMENPKGN